MTRAAEEFAALAQADPEAASRLIAKLKGHVMVPVAWQAEVERSRARFQIVRAGRQSGKTKLGARRVIRKALERPGSMNWWVANTYKNVRRGYREVLRQVPRDLLAKDPPPAGTGNELVLQLVNGSVIEFYSAGNADAMAGESLDYLIGDEAALWESSVWQQTIRPTLTVSRGGALLISTPRGQNWFWELWNRGQRAGQSVYQSWHFTPHDNPYFPDEEVEELRESLPDRLFRQEIMAEFLKGAASLFNMDEIAVQDGWEPDPDGQYVYMGVDLAKHQDFTVIRASREDGTIVWHERMRDVNWPLQREAIETAAATLIDQGADGVTIGVDTGGPGDVVFDELDERGYDVEPIKFGAPGQKYRMVKLLGADLERKRVALLEEQIEEFEAYEYHITDKGTMTFSAPEGKHDDEVAATMIEHWVRRHGGAGSIQVEDLKEIEHEAETIKDLKPDPFNEVWARDAAWTVVG